MKDQTIKTIAMFAFAVNMFVCWFIIGSVPVWLVSSVLILCWAYKKDNTVEIWNPIREAKKQARKELLEEQNNERISNR